MKLSKEQAKAIFDSISAEVNSEKNKRVRAVRKENSEMDIQALKKFKTASEYKALVSLSKNTSLYEFKKFINNNNLMHIAVSFYKVKHKNYYMHFCNEQQTIHLLAIDCKNLKELQMKVKEHYGLKKCEFIKK